jgi:hypothetical protein
MTKNTPCAPGERSEPHGIPNPTPRQGDAVEFSRPIIGE